MAFSRYLVLLLAALLPAASYAVAPTTATVWLAGGGRVENFRIEQLGFDRTGKGFLRGRAGGETSSFNAGEIWQIAFGGNPLPQGSSDRLGLADGSCLTGRVAEWGAEDNIRFHSDLFGDLVLPSRNVASLAVGLPRFSRPPKGVEGRDTLWTADGDRLVGRLLGMDREKLIFRSDLGVLRCDRSRVRAIAAGGHSGAAKDSGGWILVFSNGDRVRTRSWALENDGRLRCSVGGSPAKTPAEFLRRALHLGPRAKIFSRIQPDKFSMQPVSRGQRAIIVDRGPGDLALLGPGGREYLFGLFLRPRCEMEYRLDGSAEAFLAELAMSPQPAPDHGRARVLFSIGDGPWKAFDLEKGRLPVALSFALKGARRFRIRVEPADRWGCGAHVVLGEPVLLVGDVK